MDHTHFMPHGTCYLWTPGLVWLHVVSDSMIALAYTTIPFTLLWFVRKRKDLPFNWMFLCFGVFIVACGATHYLEIWNTWNADYWVAGWVKAATAIASVMTAILLVRLVPQAAALPSPAMHQAEIDERRRTQAALAAANSELECRVATRTTELATALAALENELAERKRAQDALVQARKMEAVGRLAGGVAHDFNNLMMVVQGNSELLMQTLPSTDARHSNVREIANAAGRAATLTQQLLAFGRKQIRQPRRLDLNQIVRGMQEIMHRLLGEGIEVACHLDPGLAPVKADRGQIDQVLMNLLLNARDATADGGSITVETSNVWLAEKPSTHGADSFQPGPFVRLVVRDTGHGMPQDVVEQVFEPFFTTKELGKGTGLGLSTVYGVVSQTGGYVEVTSEEGVGSAFTVFLPSQPAASAVGDPEPLPIERGAETILLVEDESAVRKVTRDLLESRGFRVLEAGHGMQALDVASTYAGSIDLVVTDVVMPQMDGRQLADSLRKSHPGLKVIFMSAHTDDALLTRGMEPVVDTVIRKPFTGAQLVHEVRQALDRGTDRRPGRSDKDG